MGCEFHTARFVVAEVTAVVLEAAVVRRWLLDSVHCKEEKSFN
jgi:hypothetical protein